MRHFSVFDNSYCKLALKKPFLERTNPLNEIRAHMKCWKFFFTLGIKNNFKKIIKFF